MEGFHIKKDDEIRGVSNDERGAQRERIFRELVLSQMFDSMHESLENIDFSESDIDEFARALKGLSEEDRFIVLAIPFELKERFLGGYHKKIEGGQISATEMVTDILQKNKQYGFTIGYHLSDHQIPKEGKVWNIKGTEFDDRDEMPMAYYSEDYLNRYKKKSAKFLYTIRADFHPNGSHKRDLNNHWGRATSLSVIDEYNMQQIEREIDEQIGKENAALIKKAALNAK